MTFKLGQTLRDRITGFTGLAFQRVDFLNGNIQYALQPRAKDEPFEVPEALWIDHHTLEVVSEEHIDLAMQPTETVIPKLGDKVEDTVTGFSGIATMKALYLNGCTAFLVMPRVQSVKTEQLSMPKGDWVDHKRLRVVNEQAYTPPPVPADEKGRRPGGPMNRFANTRIG